MTEIMYTYAAFRGEKSFLSNFYPCNVTYKDRTYLCSEAAYVAEKAYHQLDKDMLTKMNGKEAKAYGKKLEVTSNLWLERDTVSGKEKLVAVMFEIVLMKFAQNPELRKRLVETGDDQLIEINNWHDYFWGVCDGKGTNHLGIILMKVRELLK